MTKDTPPTFLWHTEPDDCVPVENSLFFFEALHKNKIPVEMHIYPAGGHGLSLANEETKRQGRQRHPTRVPELDGTGLRMDVTVVKSGSNCAVKLKNVLIVVKDIEKAKKFYHDLFGLDVVLDQEGNVILTEGLVLQDEAMWKNILVKRLFRK